MSYDIAIVTEVIASTDAAAWSQIDALVELQGEPPAVFRRLHDQVVARYPCLSTLDDDTADAGAWSSGPLWSGFGPVAAVLSIQHPRADEVVPFVVDTCRLLGLSVFDWTTRQIHRPDGIVGLELCVENRVPHLKPTQQQVLDAVRSLTPDGGPGFLTLDRTGFGYVQAAGGNAAYAVEWRVYEGSSFLHFTAGLSRQDDKADFQIPTNGAYVTVKSHERLSLADVEGLLSVFANGDSWPTTFTWRDITSRFL
jgi:hypothetical protein